MNKAGKVEGEGSKAQARREQVLAAAHACFLQSGFHGASMAVIAKAANMSVGHIYHYFENKEAIIAAIVEENVQHVLSNIRSVRGAPRLYEAMIEKAGERLDDVMDTGKTALMVEVLAEASRNPHVAELIKLSDQTPLKLLGELIAEGRQARPALSQEELRARAEVVAALFEGLQIRALRNPDLPRAAILPLMQDCIRLVLER
ncbi:TetR/AcrR family transcriptional regulator [Chitiniphilus eburneus]|uniref:TetR/AcrR family transcriptional regulator n=1 Tax=Chitiniphilus eburneus TaxID=2571148 RepID=A0A4U0PA38_9NEIS|nr:TetR/AcrR family transcriptional regulator [Chitiniphilus eburneus]TJZ64497.1 TetR/AcrR family transcriptional regulator [Chitiniphilus eburneus]